MWPSYNNALSRFSAFISMLQASDSEIFIFKSFMITPDIFITAKVVRISAIGSE